MDKVLVESGFVNFVSLVSGFRGPLEHRFSGTYRSIYRVYSGFMDTTVFMAWFSVGAHFFSPSLSLSERCSSGFPEMGISMVVFQNFYFYFRRQRFVALLKSYMNIFKDDNELQGQVKYYGKYFRMLTWILVILMVVVLGPFCFSPLIREFLGQPRMFAVPAKYPYDAYSSTTVFVATSLFQTFNGSTLPMRTITFDNIFYVYACRQLALSKRLSTRLREILQVASINYRGEVEYRNESGDKCSRDEAAEKCVVALREWVIKHQQSLRLLKEVERLYSPAFFISFFLLSLELCMNAFVVTTVDLSFLELCAVGLYVLGNLSQLLFTCRIGDLVYLAGEELTPATLGSHIQTLPKEVQVYLRIILTRANVPLSLSAFGVFHLNIETFKSIVLSAYSYFTMLTNIKH